MFDFHVFNAGVPALDGHTSEDGVIVIGRACQESGEAVIQLRKVTWEPLACSEQALSEVIRNALKLCGETFQQWCSLIRHEHRIRGRYFESGLSYRQGAGVNWQGQGQPWSWLIEWYTAAILQDVSRTERRLSALCRAEIIVSTVMPGRVSVYENTGFSCAF